mmetsp:Transcript_15281/g.26091  ORF Transcript_15281/g.26091 Transcript_15281/m.26091 type:complete len:107 (+) Transcript_15281:77-397(+)
MLLDLWIVNIQHWHKCSDGSKDALIGALASLKSSSSLLKRTRRTSIPCSATIILRGSNRSGSGGNNGGDDHMFGGVEFLYYTDSDKMGERSKRKSSIFDLVHCTDQ